MDQDSKPPVPVEEFEKRLVSTEKRIDDMKWFMGGFTGFFTIIFGVLTILVNLNLNSEKSALREFQRDLKSELGKVEVPPQLELLGQDKQALTNQEIPIIVRIDEYGTQVLILTHVLRNVGKSLSGPLYEKIYTKAPLELNSNSTDEPKFDYEEYFDPSRLTPNEIPGNYSTQWTLRVALKGSEKPPPGKYPVLAKVFYGKGQVVQAPFWIEISAKE